MGGFPSESSKVVLVPGCSRCPSLVESREEISWGNGPLDAEIMVVGEAPGAGSPDASVWKGGNWTGMAYTARHSGRIIRSLFADAGFDADACYFTNAVKCFPEDTDGSNREPTMGERAACTPFLFREIALIDPEVVIPTGRVATEQLFSDDDRELESFIDSVLDPVECESIGRAVVPLLHPAYQHVWLSRLGYTRDSYVNEITTVLSSLLTDAT